MSKFTTEVRYICESYAGLDHSVGYDQINEVIHASHNEIMGSYPIFDENYREALNSKILKHYYTREICEETVGLWKLRLNNRMNEIMPYYNKLYDNQNKILNSMFDNVDIKEEFIRNTNTSANSNSNSNSDSKNLFQDTPQGSLDFTELENQKWATNYNMSKGNINDSSNTSGTSDENYIKHITGNNGNKYKIEMLSMIKDNLLNIDMMIINDLQELFMQIY